MAPDSPNSLVFRARQSKTARGRPIYSVGPADFPRGPAAVSLT